LRCGHARFRRLVSALCTVYGSAAICDRVESVAFESRAFFLVRAFRNRSCITELTKRRINGNRERVIDGSPSHAMHVRQTLTRSDLQSADAREACTMPWRPRRCRGPGSFRVASSSSSRQRLIVDLDESRGLFGHTPVPAGNAPDHATSRSE